MDDYFTRTCLNSFFKIKTRPVLQTREDRSVHCLLHPYIYILADKTCMASSSLISGLFYWYIYIIYALYIMHETG